jgi:hypothetical protein
VLNRHSAEETAIMIPAADRPGCRAWTAERDRDPVVQRYRALFALLDWTAVPERDPHRAWPGSPPQPTAAYIKALLVKLGEQQAHITQLRRFLLEHPLLVLELGFRPHFDLTHPYGFDVERTVPGARWLRHQQHALAPDLLQALLGQSIQALLAEIPAMGTTVAVDVKHCYAWVRENNPKEFVAHRFDPQRQPAGDPTCRLGIKRRHNQDGAAASETLWGYGTGIISATDPVYGDVVLAEHTQPFHQPDVTFFRPLFAQVQAHLGRCPTNLAADAAFDAWHVYHVCAEQGGIAAIPLNARGSRPSRDAAGHPYCDQGQVMTPTSQFLHEDGYRAQRYRCPLLCPPPTGVTCDDARFARGGCHKRINLEAGGRMRLALDRQTESYRAIYRQRTSAERINSQATALGIERPKVRRQAAIARLNTLTYLTINLRALQRVQAINATQPATTLC